MLKKGVWFLGLLFGVLIICAIVIIVAKYVLLDMAVNQIDRSYRSLRQQAVQGTQNRLCFESATTEESGPVIYQMRFVSPTEYAFEVICFAHPLEGIEFGRTKLPPFTSRSGGSIGARAYQASDPMQFEVFGDLIQTLPSYFRDKFVKLARRTTIEFQDNGVMEKPALPALAVWTGGNLRSSCQAFGYTCCHDKNQVGRGSVLTDTLDCAGQCYPSCVNRPLVLSFGADGGYDPINRTVETQNQTDLKFSFVGQAGSAPLQSATIVFGDGQKANLATDVTEVTHQYICPNSVCKYNASITLTDQQNISSPMTVLTLLQVVVRN